VLGRTGNAHDLSVEGVRVSAHHPDRVSVLSPRAFVTEA
jgi:hypothetical protein